MYKGGENQTPPDLQRGLQVVLVALREVLDGARSRRSLHKRTSLLEVFDILDVGHLAASGVLFCFCSGEDHSGLQLNGEVPGQSASA